MKNINFECGCHYSVVDLNNKMSINYDVSDINFDCPKTWDMISEGNTKGVFQLESRLGQSMAKKLKPENVEQLAALISIMRPGCISGDTKVFINQYEHSCDGKMRFKKCKIRDIADNKDKFKTLLSYNQQTGRFVENQMTNVFYTGHKECFRVVVRSNERKKSDYGTKEYKLQCTTDHKLLTPSGWKELKDIQINERILVVKRSGTKKPGIGTKNFRQRCCDTYVEKCIFCDWNKGSLDVNHISGNRFTNNHHDNLCYMCPNHHREFTEGNICIEQINENKEKYRLPKTVDGKWCKLVDKVSVGIKDVYDISMMSPHHNFIAGGIIVHNCLEAIRDGKSVSNHFIDKKNGLESVDYFNPNLEPVLKTTYGEMVYQEQAMEIAKEIAGFNLQDADMLRKAIGKKKPEEMNKIKTKFIDGCKIENKVSESEADQIFGWIEKSQRYSFNKSHAVSYAVNAYMSAHAKAHFPLIFFLSYLRLAKDKINPHEEILDLISNAKEMDINVFGPKLYLKNKDFTINNKRIYFGLTNIKGVGDSIFVKLNDIIKDLDIEKETWTKTLVNILLEINSTAAKALIQSGALDYLKLTRNKMLHEYSMICELSKKELQNTSTLVNLYPSLSMYDILCKLRVGYKIIKTRQAKINGIIDQLKTPPFSMDDEPEWISDNERELLGISITCSKTDSYDSSYANTDCKNIKSFPTNKQFFVVAEVDSINTILTKRGKTPGQEMCFLKISDGYGSVDCVIFPEEFASNKKILEAGRVLMFNGQKSIKDNTPVIKKCFVV